MTRLAIFTRCTAYTSIFGAVLVLNTVDAQARGPLLAERTVAQWGGPETRTRCIGHFKTDFPPIKTCIEWATDFKQHRIEAKMYGPDNISNPDEQLKDIANACLISGLALAGAPAVVTAPIGLSADVVRTGVEACLKAQNVLSQIVAPGFEVTIEEEEFW